MRVPFIWLQKGNRGMVGIPMRYRALGQRAICLGLVCGVLLAGTNVTGCKSAGGSNLASGSSPLGHSTLSPSGPAAPTYSRPVAGISIALEGPSRQQLETRGDLHARTHVPFARPFRLAIRNSSHDWMVVSRYWGNVWITVYDQGGRKLTDSTAYIPGAYEDAVASPGWIDLRILGPEEVLDIPVDALGIPPSCLRTGVFQAEVKLLPETDGQLIRFMSKRDLTPWPGPAVVSPRMSFTVAP